VGSHDRVIVVVVDADGRLDLHAVEHVAPFFDDPRVGGVQVGVRINNRFTSELARMQDMEFIAYTEIFQRGRRHLNSVGLGGNGQFMRLSALLSLGDRVWSRSLTEDLDLGVRLLAHSWRNEFCASAAVHQQGVVEVRRLVRQRSRWFQGHLQCARLIPRVLSDPLPPRARADLLYHLTSPLLILMGSLLTASFLVSLVAMAATAVGGVNPFGGWVAWSYALSFGPAYLYGAVYWTRERSEGHAAVASGRARPPLRHLRDDVVRRGVVGGRAHPARARRLGQDRAGGRDAPCRCTPPRVRRLRSAPERSHDRQRADAGQRALAQRRSGRSACVCGASPRWPGTPPRPAASRPRGRRGERLRGGPGGWSRLGAARRCLA
jgi:hypothetical protein